MKNILFTLIFILFTVSLSGQTPDREVSAHLDYENPREYLIEDVTVSGVKFLQTNYLISMSGLIPGEMITIPGDEITNAIDKFWSLGLFSDVRIIATKIEGRNITLEIQLAEQMRLTKLRLHGVKKGEAKEIEEDINIKPGNQVTENLLNNASKYIKDHFIEKGFLNTSVNIIQVADTVSSGNRVYLDVNVDKGKKVRISNIEFTGNEEFKDSRLRRTMKKTKQRSINFFKPSKFSNEKYRQDKGNLLAFYNKNGYRDAKILNDNVDVLNNKRIAIKIDLEEGSKYYLRNVKWIGNTKYSSNILGQVLNMQKGDVYNQEYLNKRLYEEDDAIQSQYMDAGYLFFSINPVESIVEGDSIDLEMRISEGDPATINRITVTGNTKTNEHVVRRELRTVPGELFSRTNIIRSIRELAAMGHFNPETLTPEISPNPSDGTVDIEYVVEEKSNDQFELQGGWGGYGFVGSVGLRFANFSIRKVTDLKAWRPVPSGDGQTLSLRAQTNGRYYQSYNLSFVEPWFGGKKPNSFSVSLYYSMTKPYRRFGQTRTSGDFFKVFGTSIGLGRRLKWPDDYFVLYNEIGFQWYSLKNWGSNFVIDDGSSYVIDFNIVFSRSSQDQMIFPRRGSSFSLGLQLTPPVSLFKKDYFWKVSDAEALVIRDEIVNANPGFSENLIQAYTETEIESRENKRKFKFIEYHKWTFSSNWYSTLVGDLVLATKSEFGYLGFYNKDIGVSPFEKFDLGGSGMMGYDLYGTDIVALRGYPDGSLTPVSTVIRNGSPVAINDGNVYVKYSMELRYLISPNPQATIYALVFAEGGNAWTRFEKLNPFDIKRSAGLGVRAFLPMFGMLGVDWGYGFDLPATGVTKEERAKGHHGGEFHFVMGQQF